MVPPIQWQLQYTWIRVAVSDVSVLSAELASTPTKSPGLMLDGVTGVWSWPETISVFASTARVTLWPLSWPSCLPVQSTPTVSESAPTADTEPASQCVCGFAFAETVPPPGGAATAAKGRIAKTIAAAAIRVNLRIGEPPTVVESAEHRSTRQTVSHRRASSVKSTSTNCKAARRFRRLFSIQQSEGPRFRGL